MKVVTRLKYRCPRLSWYSIAVLGRFLSAQCHYQVLDVPKSASQEEIKKAFFEKSKKFHPDVSPGNPHHHNIFVKLNNAYSILGDKSKRKDYDRSLLPKQKIYSNQSTGSESLHRYRDGSFYYAGDFRHDFSNNAKYSASERPKNYKVALGIIILMTTGVAVRLMWIWYRHKQYKKQLDINSMKASKLYQESRERSSKYTMKEQMERLMEKQGKLTARDRDI
ncbi:dnaJ homolog subfamily C member 4-like isoform X1 [Dendronephthya gigantea]|uniref:dnaJ homolog subfamily C member 4-like isoform X1 n=1 Tax=Dendronephthya gigantea TaxID=151771 RepID=UPI00106D55E6|nr:dnaJ homolog subfamily C member 4-like isoform X1 [Dendronephthya gigantea]